MTNNDTQPDEQPVQTMQPGDQQLGREPVETKTKEETPETPPEKKEEEKQLTPEEMELNKKRFIAGMGFGEDPDKDKEEKKPEKSKEEKPEEKKEPEKPKKEPAKPKEEKEDEPKPKKRRKAAVLETDDDEETRLERAAALGAEKALSNLEEKEPEKPAATSFEANLPTSYKRDLEAFRKMEADDPRYKGLSNRMLDYYQKESAYMDNWEKENPGKTFDPNDPDHADWYAKQTPAFDPDDLEQAKESLIVQRARKEAKDEVEAKLEASEKKIKFEREFEKAQEEIKHSAWADVGSMIRTINPDVLPSLLADGKVVVSKENLEKMAQEDPFAFELLNETGIKLHALLSELEKLSRFADHYKSDWNKEVRLDNGEIIAPHMFLDKYGINLEKEIDGMNPTETIRGGKKFITQTGFRSRVQAIAQSTMTPNQKESAFRDLQGRYWTLGPQDVKRALLAEFGANTETKLKKYYDSVAKRTGNANGKAGEKTPTNSAENGGEASDKTEKPKPPTTTSASDKLNTNKPLQGANVLTAEAVDKSMWG